LSGEWTPRCSPGRPARARAAKASCGFLLGRGATDDKVHRWLRQAAPAEGFVGFAIGRSIWWDPLKGQLDESLRCEAAAQQIANNYLRFIRVYEEASQDSAVA
jgi:myo-inositol catabolism protein IolC